MRGWRRAATGSAATLPYCFAAGQIAAPHVWNNRVDSVSVLYGDGRVLLQHADQIQLRWAYNANGSAWY